MAAISSTRGYAFDLSLSDHPQNTVLLLAFLAATATTAYARNLRCPGNLNPHEVVANSYDSTKFFMCTEDGLLEEKNCAAGEEFDSKRLVGFPQSGR